MTSEKDRLFLPPPTRSVRPAFEAAAEDVPVLKTFVAWHVARERTKRDDELQLYCEKVAEKINALCSGQDELWKSINNKVDADHLWSEEFFRVFSAAGAAFQVEPNDDKRAYLVEFVRNYAGHRRPDITRAQIFWRIIAELSGTHLVVLDHLYGAQKNLALVDLQELRADRNEAVSVNSLEGVIGIERDLLNLVVQSLANAGLVRKIPPPTGGADRSPRLVVEDIGFSFLKFLNGRW